MTEQEFETIIKPLMLLDGKQCQFMRSALLGKFKKWSEAKQLRIGIVMPCFEFSNKATKYTENGVTTLAVETDGIALTNDNLPHQAYALEEGVKYTVKLYKA